MEESKLTQYPTVSVLMTAYNREKYIAEAIESVVASTYQDWELIIVDDCSTDRTVEIAKSYESKDKRIKVYVNEKNLGQFPNRNKAASLARGKYLKYLDSDDIIYTHGLGVMVEALDNFPSAGLALIDVNNALQQYPKLIKKNDAIREHYFHKPFLTIGPSGVIFRREAFEKIGCFGNDNYVGNDTKILMFISLHSDVVLMTSDLIYWREHDGQEYRKGLINFEYLINEDEVTKEVIYSPFCPLTIMEKRLLLSKTRNLIISRAFRFLKVFRIIFFSKMAVKALITHFQARSIGSEKKPFCDRTILKILRLFNGHPTRTFLSGNGIILAFHRVVEAKTSIFNEILETSLQRFEFLINHLRKYNFDFISLDELPKRLKSKSKRKFAVITFDDGYKDNYTLAYPILKKYSIPFTLYLTTSFPDGKVVLWWYLLEEVIKNNIEISFSYDGRQYIYALVEKADKERAFDSLRRFIIDSTPYAMQSKIESVLSPYIPDLYAKTKELALSWEEVKFLSQDPLVTIGNHTVNHYAMTTLSNEDILKEILTAQEIIKDKTGITTKHFAYPFGSRREVNRESLEIVKSMGYITGTTTLPGNLFNEYLYKDKLFLLPRYLMCEKASKYTLNIRMNGIYPFLANNYSKYPKH